MSNQGKAGRGGDQVLQCLAERLVVIDDQHSYVSDGRLVDGGAFVFGPGVRASHSLVI